MYGTDNAAAGLRDLGGTSTFKPPFELVGTLTATDQMCMAVDQRRVMTPPLLYSRIPTAPESSNAPCKGQT